MYAAGGGTVTLDGGKTFLSGNLILRSNVTLFFEEGAVLAQSGDPDDFVLPTADGGYTPCRLKYGHDTMSVRWGHAWYEHYPMLYAGEGSRNVAIKGKGTIRMHRGTDCAGTLHICPIGFYRVDGFEISDVTISNYSTYAMMPYTCKNGLIQNVTVDNCRCKNGDGISLMNGQNIRITGCRLNTSDDGIYIFTSYKDPRGGTWWSSDLPQPSRNMEIDHNHGTLTNGATKALALILWGANCPDQRLVEVSDVYIHDNYFQTMGIWNDDPYDAPLTVPTPVKNIRFENNTTVSKDGTSTIFTTQTPDSYDNDKFYELGTRFAATVSGTVTHVRIYTSAEESGAHTVRIWDCQTKKVVAGPYTWDVEAGQEGWRQFELPRSLHIEANRDYVVAVSTGEDHIYPKGSSTENSFAGPICNGDLITYAGSGLYSTGRGNMPDKSYKGSNYLRDIVFVAD